MKNIGKLKWIKNLTRGTLLSAVSVLSMVQTESATPADEAQKGTDYIDNGSTSVTLADLFQRIVNALLFIIGAVSVIMIVIGGIRFVFSQGDPQSSASARNTILYSVIGLVVAIMAYGIINWVLGRLYK